MPLIECQDMTIGHGRKKVAQHLDFRVDEGDYLCIVGDNGTGKSTLLKTILGLLSPLSGSLSFGKGLKQTEIGYLPQQSYMQRDFPASVQEVVLSGCLNRLGKRPFYGSREKGLVTDALTKLEILDLAKLSYRTLSGGQQQRVLLARALCATHKLLLLDEPVAGLDPQASSNMYSLLEKINLEEQITLIMISHDVDAAIDYASHVLHLGEGRMLFYGTRDTYLNEGYAYKHYCTRPRDYPNFHGEEDGLKHCCPPAEGGVHHASN